MEDNSKTDLTEIVCEYVYKIQLIQDQDQLWAIAKTVIKFRVP
jgi:hypothetical protein